MEISSDSSSSGGNGSVRKVFLDAGTRGHKTKTTWMENILSQEQNLTRVPSTSAKGEKFIKEHPPPLSLLLLSAPNDTILSWCWFAMRDEDGSPGVGRGPELQKGAADDLNNAMKDCLVSIWMNQSKVLPPFSAEDRSVREVHKNSTQTHGRRGAQILLLENGLVELERNKGSTLCATITGPMVFLDPLYIYALVGRLSSPGELPGDD